jgi:hypothetical protein
MTLTCIKSQAMKEATILHNSIIRTAIKEFTGYEVIMREANTTSGEGLRKQFP